MPINGVAYYEVACSKAGCSVTGEPWPSEDIALEEWERAGGWVDIYSGETFCAGDIPPQCEWCPRRATGSREGDLACDAHRTSTEFPQEASNG